jgi:hypothetical protein
VSDIHALFNFPIGGSSGGSRPPGGLRPAGDEPSGPSGTASSFITPQSLIAFPLASGLVVAFWKGIQVLWPATIEKPPNNGASYWTCFSIALLIALVNYVVSITDPKLVATRREKMLGCLFAVINGMYLFVTAIGIKAVTSP